MVGPTWLADVLAAIVLAVALFSAARMTASHRAGLDGTGEVDADGVHVLMGVAMAGMLVPGLATLPTVVWEVVFAIGAVWFAGRAVLVRRPGLVSLTGWSRRLGPVQCCEYPVPHLIDCLSMVYMLWAVRTVSGSSGMTAMGGASGGVRLPVLALVLALCVSGYVVWLGDRIQQLAPVRSLALAAPAGAMTGTAMAAGAVSAGAMSAGADSAGSAVAVSGALPSFGPPHIRLLAPRAATWCKIAMGVATGVMLIDLL
jgi:Domain of unknown function (DUF5134)